MAVEPATAEPDVLNDSYVPDLEVQEDIPQEPPKPKYTFIDSS